MEKRRLADLRVVDLRGELEKRGLDKNGVKASLVERLAQVSNYFTVKKGLFRVKLGEIIFGCSLRFLLSTFRRIVADHIFGFIFLPHCQVTQIVSLELMID